MPSFFYNKLYDVLITDRNTKFDAQQVSNLVAQMDQH